MKSIKRIVMSVGVVALVGATTFSLAAPPNNGGPCAGLPSAAQLKTFMKDAPALNTPPIGGTVGGLFNGTRMWGAIVNRKGEICSVATSTDEPSQVWPGSQAIAKAKAYTANAFSLDSSALSTAQLYTLVQPGHSLYGLNQSNLFNPKFLAPPSGQGGGENQVAGGIITFGGGVPLYKDGEIIGGLGISGDTACADHEIAKRVRNSAGLNPSGGPTADDISYSSVDGASPFTHPSCPNTWRNGVSIGNELPAVGY
jgi:uncharacterized protein GlcG (DUF336 family)